MYTVKQLSDLAQVTIRTLHYYDEIGLLKPTLIRENGYRQYDDGALLRLQQILFYREIGLELLQIKEILDRPDFDLVTALRSHREVLQEKITRLNNLIHTVDETIQHVTGGHDMSKKKLFEAFNEEQQKEYEREARLTYGPEHVNESVRRWNSYGSEKQQAIMDEAGAIYQSIADAMVAGRDPADPLVQDALVKWQENIRYFYEPTLEILRGLGELYNTDPRFMATFEKFHADLPAYLQRAITHYVDELEYAEIERMLAEDEQKRASS